MPANARQRNGQWRSTNEAYWVESISGSRVRDGSRRRRRRRRSDQWNGHSCSSFFLPLFLSLSFPLSPSLRGRTNRTDSKPASGFIGTVTKHLLSFASWLFAFFVVSSNGSPSSRRPFLAYAHTVHTFIVPRAAFDMEPLVSIVLASARAVARVYISRHLLLALPLFASVCSLFVFYYIFFPHFLPFALLSLPFLNLFTFGSQWI